MIRNTRTTCNDLQYQYYGRANLRDDTTAYSPDQSKRTPTKKNIEGRSGRELGRGRTDGHDDVKRINMSGWRRRTGRTVKGEVGPKRGQPGAPDRRYLFSLVCTPPFCSLVVLL